MEEAAGKTGLDGLMWILQVMGIATLVLGVVPWLTCGLINRIGIPDLAWYWKLTIIFVAWVLVLALLSVNKGLRKSLRRSVSFPRPPPSRGAQRDWQLRLPLVVQRAANGSELISCPLRGGTLEQIMFQLRNWNPFDSTGHAAYALLPELRAAEYPSNELHELEFTIHDQNDRCQGIAVGVTSLTEKKTWLCGFMPHDGCMVEGTCKFTDNRAPDALPSKVICKPPLLAEGGATRGGEQRVKMRVDFDQRSIQVKTGEGIREFEGFSGTHGGQKVEDGKFASFPADDPLYVWVRLPVTAGEVTVGFTHKLQKKPAKRPAEGGPQDKRPTVSPARKRKDGVIP